MACKREAGAQGRTGAGWRGQDVVLAALHVPNCTLSATTRWDASPLHNGRENGHHARIDFFYTPLSRRFSARRRKRERIPTGESTV